MMDAVVVGGGLSGLAVAVGLERAGHTVRVLDPDPDPDPGPGRPGRPGLGSAISLAPNGVRAIDALGLGAELRAIGHRERGTATYRPDGRIVSRLDLADESAVLGVRRDDLHHVLRGALSEGVVRSGTTVLDVDPSVGTVVVEGGDELHTDLVVGADGVGSLVRATVAPGSPPPVNSGYRIIRAAVDIPGELPDDFGLVWGPGVEFGWLRLPGGRVEWHAQLLDMSTGPRTTTVGDLAARLASWPAPIPALMDRTPSASLVEHGVRVLPRPLLSYTRNRAALVGDAAHPVVPNLGQGASLGLEDAVELAAELSLGEHLATALERYDQRRRPRDEAVARKAARVARASLTRNPALISVRNRTLQHTPRTLAARSVLAHLNWTPPRIHSAPAGGEGTRG